MNEMKKYEAIREAMHAGGHWSVMETCGHEHRSDAAAERCAGTWERRNERANRANIEAGLSVAGNNRYLVRAGGDK
jgi:hypothetical protein